MIEVLSKSHGKILGVKASGKVTAEDYEDVLIPAADKLLSNPPEDKKARFLYYLSGEFEGFEFGAVWDDIKYIGGHSKRFEKVALVGGPRWVEWTTKIANAFMEAEVKTFPADKLDEAWQWIEEDASATPACDSSGTSEHARPASEDEPCKEPGE